MCHWKKWIWPGILTVAILSALALWMKTDLIQNDLQAKTTEALQAEGQGWASVTMDGRDATIIGAAPSEEDQSLAAEITDEAYEVRIVDNRTELLAAQSPYVLKATRNGRAVELTGFVPNEATRQTIVAAANEALPNIDIKDSMTLARGAPETLTAMAGFGLTQLNGLSSGEMSLSNSDLTMTGAATDREAYDAINTALDGELPGGAKLVLKEITAPSVSPYTWGADYSGDKVTLTGFVPSAETAKSIADTAKSALPNAEIEDNQLIASGEPEGFSDATSYALQQLPRFNSGNVALSDLNLTVNGVAKTTDNYTNALGAVVATALPAGMALAGSDIKPATVSPYEWRAQYDGSKTILSGFIPDNATRESVTVKTREVLGESEIDDQMQIADGAPDGFSGATDFALEQLPRFKSGEVVLSDLNLTVNGVANTTDSYNDALGAITASALPAGLALSGSDITPATVSPYEWRAQYDGSKAVLSGFVPDNAARESVTTKTKEVLGTSEIDDQMQIADGAPEGFIGATGFALEQLPQFSSGSVGLQDLALTIEGVSRDSENYTAAKKAVSGTLPDGMALAAEKITPSTVAPYTWRADYDGSSVSLTGYTPSDAARAAINEQVKATLPDATVSDDMLVAQGDPADFTEATGFAIEQLPRFSSGFAALSDQNLTIEGVAKSSEDYEAGKAAANGDLPAQMALASENILPPTVSPYKWRGDYNGTELELSGLAPSDEARATINEQAKAALPNAKILDKMRLAQGQPEGFTDATDFALQQLPRFTNGMVGLSDLNLTVEGVAKTSEDYDQGKKSLAGDLVAGMSLANETIVPPTVSPYSWGADYDGKTVVLNGLAPDEEARAAVVEAASKELPNAEVVDRMQIAAGAPEQYGAVTAAAIGILPRFSAGDVALSGTDLTVNGVGKTSADFLAADDYAKSNLPDGAKLAAANIQPPANDGPWTWKAVKEGDRITLSGLTPSQLDGSAIAQSAGELNPGTTIVNNMNVVTGAPTGFIANTKKGMSLLDGLTEGTATIVDEKLSIVGIAKTVSSYETSQQKTAGNLTEGYTWDVRDITPPTLSPYSWSIDDTGEKTVLSGFVPNRGIGNSHVAASKVTLEKEVDDRQRVAGGAPDGFGNAVAVLISGANELENVTGSITDTNVFIQGRAPSEEEAGRIGKSLGEALPSNFKYRKQISYPLPKHEPVPEPKPEPKSEPAPEQEPVVEAPKQCMIDFASLLGNEKINFETNRAVIKDESFGLLDRIATALKAEECANARIEVGGHTDSRGREEYNQRLSEDRAQAVVAYMGEKQGIKASALSAVGYGELQPIAPNTKEERAKNRRIEFKLLTQN